MEADVIEARIGALFHAVAFLYAVKLEGLSDADAHRAMEILAYPFAPRRPPEAGGPDGAQQRRSALIADALQ